MGMHCGWTDGRKAYGEFPVHKCPKGAKRHILAAGLQPEASGGGCQCEGVLGGFVSLFLRQMRQAEILIIWQLAIT